LLAGGAIVAVVVWRQAARGTGKRLFLPVVRRTDALVAACALIAAGVFAAMRIAGAGDVAYLPFPALHAPSYSLALAAASLLLLAPLLAGDSA
jgi:hypothetical protein